MPRRHVPSSAPPPVIVASSGVAPTAPLSEPPGSLRTRRQRYAILLTVAAAATSSQAFGRFTFSLLYPSIRDGFHVSNTLGGTLALANLGAYLTGTLLVSLLVGRVGLSRVTRIGLVGVTCGLGLLAWSPTYGVALVGLVFTGMFAAGVWITVPAMVSLNVDASRRGAALGMVGGAMGVGMVAASLLGARVGASHWRDVYRVECVFSLVTLTAALVLLGGDVNVHAPSNGFAVIRTVRGWVRVLLAYSLFGWSMALTVTFLVAVLNEDNGYSADQALIAFSAMGFGTVIGGPTFGPLSDRVGRRPTIIAAYLIMAASSAGIGWGAYPWGSVAAFMFGTAFTGVPTMIAAIMSDSVEPSEFGGAYGVATLAFGLGLMAAPQVGGILADAAGSFHPVYAIATAGSLVAAALLSRPVGRSLRP